MPKQYQSVCCHCGKVYKGRGKYFCSKTCSIKFHSGSCKLSTGQIFKLFAKFKEENIEPIKIIKANEAAVCADFHFPYVDEEMLSKLVDVSKFLMKPPRTIIIGGDLIDFSKISVYENRIKDGYIDLDINSTRLGLNILLQTFDNIYLCLGNHDIRFLRKLDWFLSVDEFIRSIISSEKITVSMRPSVILESKGVKFYITHPTSYSRIGKVPVDLCTKYRMPVLSFHGHLFHIRSDPSGVDFGYDVGCMTRPSDHVYLQVRETTHPVWTRGFCIIRNGTVYPFTSNPKLTDWSFWLDELPGCMKNKKLGDTKYDKKNASKSKAS